MRKWFELDLEDVRKEIETVFKVTLELRNHCSVSYRITDRGGIDDPDSLQNSLILPHVL